MTHVARPDNDGGKDHPLSSLARFQDKSQREQRGRVKSMVGNNKASGAGGKGKGGGRKGGKMDGNGNVPSWHMGHKTTGKKKASKFFFLHLPATKKTV